MTPAEVWCERCEAPSTQEVETASGKHAMCDKHAAELRYKINGSAFKHTERKGSK